MFVLVLATGIALGVSFICSFVEAGLLSLTPANVAELTREDPAKGRIWVAFKENIGRPISVILILNTTAHTIGAAVAGAKFDELYGGEYLWLFSLFFTFLMLQYTEILPKTLGVRYRRLFARNAAIPLEWAVKLLSPLISFIHFVNRPFEKKGEQDGQEGENNTIQEITSLASMARMTKLIGRHQEKIIFSATRLAGTTASQVMIPVGQVVFLSTNDTIHEAFLIAHQDLHTRYPVRNGEHPSQIMGYVNFKELVYFMSTNPNNPSLIGIIRPLLFVSPETSASDLLKLFVDQHNHMVVVRSASGENQGIVTVEDVIEELVGEIEDEFDRLPQYVHSLAGGVWLAGGGATMTEVGRSLGGTLDARPDETLGDWLAGALGPRFKRGDTIVRSGFEFSVRRIKRGRIFDTSITDIGTGQTRSA